MWSTLVTHLSDIRGNKICAVPRVVEQTRVCVSFPAVNVFYGEPIFDSGGVRSTLPRFKASLTADRSPQHMYTEPLVQGYRRTLQ